MAWPGQCCSHAYVQSKQVTGSVAHNPPASSFDYFLHSAPCSGGQREGQRETQGPGGRSLAAATWWQRFFFLYDWIDFHLL